MSYQSCGSTYLTTLHRNSSSFDPCPQRQTTLSTLRYSSCHPALVIATDRPPPNARPIPWPQIRNWKVDFLSCTPSNRSDISAYSSYAPSVTSVNSFGSTTSTRWTIIPLYNLQAHNVMPNIVPDAGTDARAAKFPKRGLEVIGLAVLDPTEVWNLGRLPGGPSSPTSDQPAAESVRNSLYNQHLGPQPPQTPNLLPFLSVLLVIRHRRLGILHRPRPPRPRALQPARKSSSENSSGGKTPPFLGSSNPLVPLFPAP